MKEYHLFDQVIMKKPHACGNNSWIITRMGIDIKIKCQSCHHEVMLDRHEFEKKVKKIIIGENNESNQKY